jgi:hypothetical protein
MTLPNEPVCTDADCPNYGHPVAQFTCPSCGKPPSRPGAPSGLATGNAALIATPVLPAWRSMFRGIRGVVAGLVIAFIVIALLLKLTEGPTTKGEVCDGYDKLGDRLNHANGLFDNAIFNAAGDLGDLADRFDGPPDLSGDAEALQSIGDSHITSGFELASASRNIARLCGHPLGV